MDRDILFGILEAKLNLLNRAKELGDEEMEFRLYNSINNTLDDIKLEEKKNSRMFWWGF